MGITVRRWQRYGHDRWYVNEDGRRLGWLDAVTGEVVVEAASRADDVREALRSVTPGAAVPAPRAASEPTAADLAPVGSSGPEACERAVPEAAAPTPSHRPDAFVEDLATRRPGAAARARADELWQDAKTLAPVKARVLRWLDTHTDERAWRVGAKGEEVVGRRLDRLTKHGWTVLHAVPASAGGRDIDHLLIGPGGVWSVNTKTHPGKKVSVSAKGVYVTGHAQPYLYASRHEAASASQRLSAACGFPVTVRAALVFVSTAELKVRSRPQDVAVLEALGVPRAFRRLAPVLDGTTIARVAEAARRPGTWLP